MQIPRGTFSAIRKGIHIRALLLELKHSRFTGSCIISHGRTNISLILKNGNCLLAGWQDLNGEESWRLIQELGDVEVDAALSSLSPAQIALTLEFNKEAIVTRTRRSAKDERRGDRNRAGQVEEMPESGDSEAYPVNQERSKFRKMIGSTRAEPPAGGERTPPRSSRELIIPPVMRKPGKPAEPIEPEVKKMESLLLSEPCGESGEPPVERESESRSPAVSGASPLLHRSGKTESFPEIERTEEEPDTDTRELEGRTDNSLEFPPEGIDLPPSVSHPEKPAEVPETDDQAREISASPGQGSSAPDAFPAPVQGPDVGDATSGTDTSPDDGFIQELAALDSMDLPGMTEKIRDNCRILVQGLQLEHLLDRKKLNK